ncbi:hypothetical protein [Phaeovulum sp. NW3]|uniref:hypothetical protein n=1 Tax=Phaeovulum sp. NW3 TaxID=2934933 RepID=UPI002021CD0F|nr:hypothetical protein [Phaeovulum sp. NW3]MCL7463464.1 hypothetical protein [Phaeovulum sp. NW3]
MRNINKVIAIAVKKFTKKSNAQMGLHEMAELVYNSCGVERPRFLPGVDAARRRVL